MLFVDRFLPTNLTFLHLLISHVNGTFGSDGFIVPGIMEGDLNAAQVSISQPVLPVNLPTSYQNSTERSDLPEYNIQIKPADTIPAGSEVLTRGIPWISCPQINRRTLVDSKTNASTILTNLDGTKTILAEWRLNGGTGANVIFFSMEIMENNIGFVVWPYFNFLMYVCTYHSLFGYPDEQIETFNQWPWSPVPDMPTIIGWFVMIGGLWVITLACFAKYKNKRPETIGEKTKAVTETQKNTNDNGGSMKHE